MSMVSQATIYQNRPCKLELQLSLPNAGGAFPLPGTAVANFFRHNNTTPFVVATVANTKLVITAFAAYTRVELNLPNTDMLAIEGYGSIEIRDAAAGQIVTSVPCQFVKEGTPYTKEFGAKLAIFSETIVCVVETFYTITDVPNNAVTNAKLADMASGTLKGRLTALAGDPEDLTPSQVKTLLGFATDEQERRKGLDAWAEISSLAKGGLAQAIDLQGGGYARVEGDATELRSIEQVAGLVLTNATGGKILTRKKRFQNIAANSLRRPHHGKNQAAAGALFEAGMVYDNYRSQPTRAQLQFFQETLNDVAAPATEVGNWLSWGVATVSATAGYYGNNPIVTGSDYWIACEVIMDDGLVPVPGLNTISGDFALYVGNTIGVKNPLTGAAGHLVEGPFENNKYIVSGYATAAATATYAAAVFKYLGQSSRTFKTGIVQSGPGRYPPSLFDIAAPGQNTRAADVLRVPVSGFTWRGISLAVDFIAPQQDAASHCIASIYGDAQNRMSLHCLNAQLIAEVRWNNVVQTTSVVNGMVAGNRYKACASVSQKLRMKARGIAAPAEQQMVDQPGLNPTLKTIGSRDGTADWLQAPVRTAALLDRELTATEINDWVEAA